MSHNAPVRIRRATAPEPTLRLLAFPIRQHWFCIPLAIARRVLPKEPLDHNSLPDLIQLKNETIPVLDAASLVYGTHASQLPEANAVTPAPLPPSAPVPHILVVEGPEDDSVGLLIDGQPVLRRLRPSSFSPVPPLYLQVHQMRGILSVVNPDPQVPDSPSQPMFLLAMESLIPT